MHLIQKLCCLCLALQYPALIHLYYTYQHSFIPLDLAGMMQTEAG